MQKAAWSPTRPTSRGAVAYHDAVVNTSWHKKNIDALIKIINKKIKTGATVVDFGAGTGASAIYFLKNIKTKYNLLLIDNSASWLTKAYEILHKNKNVTFHILEKKENSYMTLDEVVGKKIIDHVLSANTVHLIPNIKETFNGIHAALKDSGTFTFQSGNILQTKRTEGILMIDDSINEIHDLALEIIKNDSLFKQYKPGLNKQIKEQLPQRKFVFPTPRPLEYYTDILKNIGFKKISVIRKPIKVYYKDWLNFVRVRRLQAGILPEIGGRNPSEQEEQDRDKIITKAALQLFTKLKKQNALATNKSFSAEWVYVYAEK